MTRCMGMNQQDSQYNCALSASLNSYEYNQEFRLNEFINYKNKNNIQTKQKQNTIK